MHGVRDQIIRTKRDFPWIRTNIKGPQHSHVARPEFRDLITVLTRTGGVANEAPIVTKGQILAVGSMRSVRTLPTERRGSVIDIKLIHLRRGAPIVAVVKRVAIGADFQGATVDEHAGGVGAGRGAGRGIDLENVVLSKDKQAILTGKNDVSRLFWQQKRVYDRSVLGVENRHEIRPAICDVGFQAIS